MSCQTFLRSKDKTYLLGHLRKIRETLLLAGRTVTDTRKEHFFSVKKMLLASILKPRRDCGEFTTVD